MILKLEGRLTTAWVDEFARALAVVKREGGKVILDLDGLSFADGRGVGVLREAIESGAQLVGGSQFIGALIDQERRP